MRHFAARGILVALLICSLIWPTGCAPNRQQWMSQAAQGQAKLATGPIGDQQEVKKESRVAAQVLRKLSADASNSAPGPNKQAVLMFAQDATLISGGLDAIAESQTDEQFTEAVWSMCDSDRRVAAPNVGRMMLGLANMFRGHVASDPSHTQQLEQMATYFDTFGERLVNIPSECDHASSAMAEASAEEQQAEVNHQANVNTATTAAALLFAGAVVLGSSVASAEASRPIIVQSPPVQNNYYYGN
jgi:hypothetical protein